MPRADVLFKCVACGKQQKRFWTAKNCMNCGGSLEKIADDLPELRASEERVQIGHPGIMEHDVQTAFFDWVGVKQNRYPALELFHAIPNGGYRPKATGNRMKKEGTKSGMPDTHLPVARQGCHSLYIEFKKPGGKLSKEQKKILPMLRAEGNRVEVCDDSIQAIKVVMDYLGIPPAEADNLFE